MDFDRAGEKGRRIRELTRIVQNRFQFGEGQVELYAERIDVRGLCAQTQAESLRCVFSWGWPPPRHTRARVLPLLVHTVICWLLPSEYTGLGH